MLLLIICCAIALSNAGVAISVLLRRLADAGQSEDQGGGNDDFLMEYFLVAFSVGGRYRPRRGRTFAEPAGAEANQPRPTAMRCSRAKDARRRGSSINLS